MDNHLIISQWAWNKIDTNIVSTFNVFFRKNGSCLGDWDHGHSVKVACTSESGHTDSSFTLNYTPESAS